MDKVWEGVQGGVEREVRSHNFFPGLQEIAVNF